MFIVECKKAKDVEIGELIKSRDVENLKDQYRLVLNKMFPVVNDQVEIATKSGASICSSQTHPMAFVADGVEQYKETRFIEPGDLIITTTGYDFVVKSYPGEYDENFIDFTVDQNNNYYAGNSPDKLILAHNSATLAYPIWHLEAEDLLVLKNNKGTEDNRIRHMDYSVQFNKVMYERLLSGGNITLFSPSDVPGLYDAFFADQDQFRKLYEAAEANPAIRKKTIKAVDLFSQFAQERKDTGRIYLQNVDHANSHSPFDPTKAPIRQSNLCLTGDTNLDIQWPDGRKEQINMQSFVERWELGGMHGARVKSRDTQSNQTVWCEVSAAAHTATVTELIEIEDEAGHIIKCTPDHQILTKNRGYVMAKDLLETDELCAEI